MKANSKFLIASLLLAGCDTVTELRCTDEQIVKAESQFDWCVTGNPDMRRTCWNQATAAHCEVSKQYQRVGVDLEGVANDN